MIVSIEISPAETTEATIVRGVLRLARALRRSVPAGEVSGGALSLLAVLHAGGPMSAVSAALRAGLQPQSLSRLLLRLEQDGLIQRDIVPTDRRRHVITLTQAGLAALGRAMSQRRDWLSSAMTETLAVEERATLARAAELMLRLATDHERKVPLPSEIASHRAAPSQENVHDID